MGRKQNALPAEFLNRVVAMVQAGGTADTIAALIPPSQCRKCGRETRRSRVYCSRACQPVSLSKKAERQRGKATYTRSDKQALLASFVEAQGGQCAACAGDGGKRGLLLDHDHQTGKPRAALCHGCNSAFGLLGESVERIEGLLKFARGLHCKAVA
jgi:predicted nucleic acid-binding Zn ribbon protein